MRTLAFGSGVVGCVALVVGFGLLGPVNGTISGVCELIAIVSGTVIVGLLDGA